MFLFDGILFLNGTGFWVRVNLTAHMSKYAITFSLTHVEGTSISGIDQPVYIPAKMFDYSRWKLINVHIVTPITKS